MNQAESDLRQWLAIMLRDAAPERRRWLDQALAAARGEGRRAGLEDAARLVESAELADGSAMPGRKWTAKEIRALAVSDQRGNVEADRMPCGCRESDGCEDAK